jgi:hypothetical protein
MPSGGVADKWTLILEALTEKGGVAIHALERIGRRGQPKDAHPDRTPHGARRPNYEL